MEKKNIFLPFILAGLFIAFIIISILVIITKEHPSLIKKKLKIGAAILTITALFYTNSCSTQPMCYNVVQTDYIEIMNENYNYEETTLNLQEDNILKCKVYQRYSENYSFRVTDSENNIIQSDNITASDGVFDENEEEFEIEINKDIKTGNYFLYFYSFDKEEQQNNPDYYLIYYVLKILND